MKSTKYIIIFVLVNLASFISILTLGFVLYMGK